MTCTRTCRERSPRSSGPFPRTASLLPAPARFGGPGPARVPDRVPGVTGRLGGPPPLRSTAAPCSRSTTSPSATAPFARSTARRSRRVAAGSSASSGPTAPARRRRCAASSGSPTPDSGDGPLGRPARSTPRPGCGSATCPSSAGSTRGCASASSSRTSASTTACRARAARTQDGRVAGAVRARRTARSRSSRTSRTATSSGSSSRRRSSTTRSCSCSTSRSAASTRSASRRWPSVLRERAGAGVGVVFSSHQLDLVEEVCEDVVIISRGRVVAEGEIEELKARSGRRHLDVEVAGSGGAWLDSTNHHTVLERDGDRVKLLVDERADLDALLAAARRRGRGPPLQLRAAQALGAVHGGRQRAPAGRRPMARCWRPSREPAARDPPRREARDHRARPQPRLRPVARCSRWSCMVRRVHRPGAAHRPGDRVAARARRRDAGRARGGDPGHGGPRSTLDVALYAVPDRGRGRAPRSATAGSTPRCTSRPTSRPRAT